MVHRKLTLHGQVQEIALVPLAITVEDYVIRYLSFCKRSPLGIASRGMHAGACTPSVLFSFASGYFEKCVESRKLNAWEL